MSRVTRALFILAIVTFYEAAWADNLTVPIHKHVVNCRSLAACPIRKPNGVSGWELLTKEVQLDEKGEGVWLADFSKAKSFASGKAQLRVLAANGNVIEVEAKLSK